jgi:hypothetical protein
MTVLDYNLAVVQCVVSDFRVTGWAESDAASFSPMSDLVESKSSADGFHVAISRVNDPRWEGTLKVSRGTAAFRLLMEAVKDQLADSDSSGTVRALAFSIYDPVEGTKIAEKGMRFTRWPDLAFNKSAGEAEFKVLLPNPTITGGANVATS